MAAIIFNVHTRKINMKQGKALTLRSAISNTLSPSPHPNPSNVYKFCSQTMKINTITFSTRKDEVGSTPNDADLYY
jgi:hypothetical protein